MQITVDALYFLLILEFVIIVVISGLYIYSKNRKQGVLYRKTTEELREALSIIEELEDKIEDMRGAEIQKPSSAFALTDVSGDGAGIEDMDEESLKGRIRKLQEIIDFQKSKIVDLMCYKDILETAQKKLGMIHHSNSEIQGRLVKLMGRSIENRGFAEALDLFVNNNNELASYIEVLRKENASLDEKFRSWQRNLEILLEAVATGDQFDEDAYAEVLREKEELVLRLKAFDDMLQKKSRLMEDMKRQYEDLEKEYMILFKHNMRTE